MRAHADRGRGLEERLEVLPGRSLIPDDAVEARRPIRSATLEMCSIRRADRGTSSGSSRSTCSCRGMHRGGGAATGRRRDDGLIAANIAEEHSREQPRTAFDIDGRAIQIARRRPVAQGEAPRAGREDLRDEPRGAVAWSLAALPAG